MELKRRRLTTPATQLPSGVPSAEALVTTPLLLMETLTVILPVPTALHDEKLARESVTEIWEGLSLSGPPEVLAAVVFCPLSSSSSSSSLCLAPAGGAAGGAAGGVAP